MGALGLLALFIRANFSLICNTPRDGVFPDRVKIKITISRIAQTNIFDLRMRSPACRHSYGSRYVIMTASVQSS